MLQWKNAWKTPSWLEVDLEVVGISQSRFSRLIVCDETLEIMAACASGLDDDMSKTTSIGIVIIGKLPSDGQITAAFVMEQTAASPSQGISFLGSQTDLDRTTNFRPKKTDDTERSRSQSPAGAISPPTTKAPISACGTPIQWAHERNIAVQTPLLPILSRYNRRPSFYGFYGSMHHNTPQSLRNRIQRGMARAQKRARDERRRQIRARGEQRNEDAHAAFCSSCEPGSSASHSPRPSTSQARSAALTVPPAPSASMAVSQAVVEGEEHDSDEIQAA
ncbi:hypothetical protein M413DRAFT_21913 [Hebeloma cylindrosporum]|uniref:Uncharacterized protein n=1 Tax=Hebeloma cylindrosporum TaxID=76867 RepID=A0A0C2YJ20_HEBCY|nr:hypothetical protein M413DRAFT_21913 [Hebeloma cylindrosporum h7]